MFKRRLNMKKAENLLIVGITRQIRISICRMVGCTTEIELHPANPSNPSDKSIVLEFYYEPDGLFNTKEITEKARVFLEYLRSVQIEQQKAKC